MYRQVKSASPACSIRDETFYQPGSENILFICTFIIRNKRLRKKRFNDRRNKFILKATQSNQLLI